MEDYFFLQMINKLTALLGLPLTGKKEPAEDREVEGILDFGNDVAVEFKSPKRSEQDNQ